MEDIVPFTLTTQEKNTIAEIVHELQEIILIMLENNVSSPEISQTNIFDIIYRILENSEHGKGNAMRLALVGIQNNDGKILLETNNMANETKLFFEDLLSKQLEYFAREIPKIMNKPRRNQTKQIPKNQTGGLTRYLEIIK